MSALPSQPWKHQKEKSGKIPRGNTEQSPFITQYKSACFITLEKSSVYFYPISPNFSSCPPSKTSSTSQQWE